MQATLLSTLPHHPLSISTVNTRDEYWDKEQFVMDGVQGNRFLFSSARYPPNERHD